MMFQIKRALLMLGIIGVVIFMASSALEAHQGIKPLPPEPNWEEAS